MGIPWQICPYRFIHLSSLNILCHLTPQYTHIFCVLLKLFARNIDWHCIVSVSQIENASESAIDCWLNYLLNLNRISMQFHVVYTKYSVYKWHSPEDLKRSTKYELYVYLIAGAWCELFHQYCLFIAFYHIFLNKLNTILRLQVFGNFHFALSHSLHRTILNFAKLYGKLHYTFKWTDCLSYMRHFIWNRY